MADRCGKGWRYWLNDMQECEAGEHGEFWADEFQRVLDAHLAGNTNGTWQEWRDLRVAQLERQAQLERERPAWDQLLGSVRLELSLAGWLECCDQPGPLHADDCPDLLEWRTHGTHRE